MVSTRPRSPRVTPRKARPRGGKAPRLGGTPGRPAARVRRGASGSEKVALEGPVETGGSDEIYEFADL